MKIIRVQVELQLETPPAGQQVFGGQPEEDMSELDEPLLWLADDAVAPPRGGCASCSCDSEACRPLEDRHAERSLQSMRLQLQFLMGKADDLHNCLKNDGLEHREREALAAAVPSFLYTCQPYFNHLESTARSNVSRNSPLPLEVYTELLDFSQQLCDKLEQLMLTYARHSLLCLDETKPDSLSHFCIGQTQLGRLRLTVFRYCKPTPYLAQVNTGLYKRMRWNVERLRDGLQQAGGEQGGGSEDTEYYFLCYEDIPIASAEAFDESQGVSHGNVVRMWSIGQWVQINPNTEDIYDWIMCEVPQAYYHQLLFLGSDEPSSSGATELLQQLLCVGFSHSDVTSVENWTSFFQAG
ncbi:putative UPF0575 protein C19orf67 -like [Scophthalmus maximus]|uniref:Putative UPF0575 protein C19orf67-like n=1 Tax=Scophthalmus maximus TaxID=52904 RepID=A0A2U9BQP4_SCOMX|nr:putative UPF0575 protein C19orf67 -like [Scophthalmus maximus]